MSETDPISFGPPHIDNGKQGAEEYKVYALHILWIGIESHGH